MDRDGNQTVWINGFMPADGDREPAATTVAPRANRTPTQKADAASNAPNDDIPFIWLVPMLTAIAAGVIA